MQNSNRNISQVKYIQKTNSLLVKTPTGESYFINLNLVLYAADMPYVRKSGEKITIKQIHQMKEKAKEYYTKAIARNSQLQTQAS